MKSDFREIGLEIRATQKRCGEGNCRNKGFLSRRTWRNF